jgi:hypothetical protein
MMARAGVAPAAYPDDVVAGCCQDGVGKDRALDPVGLRGSTAGKYRVVFLAVGEDDPDAAADFRAVLDGRRAHTVSKQSRSSLIL